jgi:flagellar transcriptional activator FlhD
VLEEEGLKVRRRADVTAETPSPQSVALTDEVPPPHTHTTNAQGNKTMNASQILTEIREANLSYLMLAQSLIRADREQALFRLGISEESAALIALLTPAQMMKIASGNTLLCKFRMEDDLVWELLTNHGRGAANETTTRLHASILMAGRHQEAA